MFKIKSKFTREKVLILFKKAYDLGKKYYYKNIDENKYFNYFIDEV